MHYIGMQLSALWCYAIVERRKKKKSKTSLTRRRCGAWNFCEQKCCFIRDICSCFLCIICIRMQFQVCQRCIYIYTRVSRIKPKMLMDEILPPMISLPYNRVQILTFPFFFLFIYHFILLYYKIYCSGSINKYRTYIACDSMNGVNGHQRIYSIQ